MILRLFLGLAFLPVVVHAGTRTSTSYTIATDTADLGGVRTTPADISREGYVGQLTELMGFTLASSATMIPQRTTCQLSGTATLDGEFLKERRRSQDAEKSFHEKNTALKQRLADLEANDKQREDRLAALEQFLRPEPPTAVAVVPNFSPQG